MPSALILGSCLRVLFRWVFICPGGGRRDGNSKAPESAMFHHLRLIKENEPCCHPFEIGIDTKFILALEQIDYSKSALNMPLRHFVTKECFLQFVLQHWELFWISKSCSVTFLIYHILTKPSILVLEKRKVNILDLRRLKDTLKDLSGWKWSNNGHRVFGNPLTRHLTFNPL